MVRNDTIAAVATARGASALAIVRLSGPRAVEVASACFESGSADALEASAGRSVHVGRVVSQGREVIDHVVATVFRSPASPTGEDVVEFTCHGGTLVPRRVLEILLASGARMAAPGEFTQRAFVNGKMDLTQAEAVADLIHARTERTRQVALRQLEGRFSHLLGRLRDELLDLCGLIELELDFSDTDQVFADLRRLRGILKQGEGTITSLLGRVRSGDMVRDGVRVVIGGLPNAGKSTLMNALVGHDRAIVSETAGTTRDLVEADLELDGVLYRLVDTAGLRDSPDGIEEEGVRRARAAARSADVLVYVYDLSAGLSEDESRWLQQEVVGFPERCVLLVGNKADLVSGTGGSQEGAVGEGVLAVSARRGLLAPEEMEILFDALQRAAEPLLRGSESSPALLNARHVAHLTRARDALLRVEKAMDEGLPGDLLAVDLRMALDELGAITGHVTSEEVLDRIFSRFCIGK